MTLTVAAALSPNKPNLQKLSTGLGRNFPNTFIHVYVILSMDPLIYLNLDVDIRSANSFAQSKLE